VTRLRAGGTEFDSRQVQGLLSFPHSDHTGPRSHLASLGTGGEVAGSWSWLLTSI